MRCDRPLQGVRKPKPANPEYRVYKCERCGAAISTAMTDRVALDVVAARLAHAVGLAEAMATDDDAGRLDEIHRALEAVDARRPTRRPTGQAGAADAALHALSEARRAADEEGDADAVETLRALAHEWLTSVAVAPHVHGQTPGTRLTVE